MLGPTHMIAGAAAAAGLLHWSHAPPAYWAPGLALGAVAGLLPDLDMPGSTAARAIPGYEGVSRGTLSLHLCGLAAALWVIPRLVEAPIPPTLWMLPAGAAAVSALTALLLREVITHRGPTHSLLALVLVAIGLPRLWGALPAELQLSLAAGYASHILIDLFNPNGAALLWPLSARKWSVRDTFLLFPCWLLVVRTGSTGERYGWRPVLWLLLIGVLVWHFGPDPVTR